MNSERSREASRLEDELLITVAHGTEDKAVALTALSYALCRLSVQLGLPAATVCENVTKIHAQVATGKWPEHDTQN